MSNNDVKLPDESEDDFLYDFSDNLIKDFVIPEFNKYEIPFDSNEEKETRILIKNALKSSFGSKPEFKEYLTSPYFYYFVGDMVRKIIDDYVNEKIYGNANK